MRLTETHKRDYVLTPAELLAASGMASGLQKEVDIYISEVRPDEIHFNARFGVLETYPGYLVVVAHARL